jgi:hypothetical protein
MSEQALVEAIRDRTVIGFIGAGFSISLGLPSFSRLMTELAADLGYDPDLFQTLGQPWTLAEYYRIQRSGIGELRSRLDGLWHGGAIDIGRSRLHESLVNLQLPIIYTTNWDRWIEAAYTHHGRDFQVIRNVGDLRKVRENVTQIVKFHGDFSDDESLVLAESAYFERMSFTTPLDIKLISDVLGRTILFLGHSLADTNIRFLLYRLHQLWRTSRFEGARPQSFIVLDRPNPVQEAVFQNWGVESVVLDGDEPPDSRLASFLATIGQEAYS